jgi:hypothetical protein
MNDDEKEEKRLKCEIVDGELTFCDSLEDKLPELANAHKKGLTQITTFKMKSGNYKNIGVCYKKDMHDRGSMINFCPWCGEKIQNWDDKDE